MCQFVNVCTTEKKLYFNLPHAISALHVTFVIPTFLVFQLVYYIYII